MTKKQALKLFRELFPHSTFELGPRNGQMQMDYPARRETWNDFTDALCKSGEITLKQYETWVNPF